MAGVGESSLGVCQGKQVPQSPFGGCLGGFQPAKARFLGLFRPTAPVPGRPWPQGPVPLTLARVASCAPTWASLIHMQPSGCLSRNTLNGGNRRRSRSNILK